MLPLTARNLARWDEKNSAPTIERIPIAASQGQKSLEVNCGLLGGLLDVHNVDFKIPQKLDHCCVSTDHEIEQSILDIFAVDGSMLESPVVSQDDHDQGLRRFFGTTSTDNICPSLSTRIPVAMKSSSTLMDELLGDNGNTPADCFVDLRCIDPKPSIEALCAARVLARGGMTLELELGLELGLHDEDNVANAVNGDDLYLDRGSAIDRLLYNTSTPTTTTAAAELGLGVGLDDHNSSPMGNINGMWKAACVNAPSQQHHHQQQQGSSRLWMTSLQSPVIPVALQLDMVEVRSHPNTKT